MSIEFRLPELGENIAEADVAEVLVKEGDRIEAEQSVMELETEKAVLELPCPHAGVVKKVHVSEGATIQVGDVILTIDDADDADSDETESEEPAPAEEPQETAVEEETTEKPATKKPDAQPEKQKSKPPKSEPAASASAKPDAAVRRAAAQPRPEEDTPPPPAGPSTRRFARKLGVDLHQVSGTGPDGRITQEDVESFVRNKLEAGATGGGPRTAPPLPDFTQFGDVERQRLSKLQRTAADQLTTSWQAIPHVTQHDLADITELESVRKQYMRTTGKDGPKITMTAIALKACAHILHEMPHFNSSLDPETNELVLKKYFHIGVAVDTDHGLVVPVVRDADRKSILEIADELTHLAEKARDRKLALDDMQGATFTITNLGGIGGTAFTPIVNYPEVAILGMSRARPTPALIDGDLEERLMLPLSLSYDHRVINGADAARFVVRLSALLAQPFGLLANV